MSKLYLQIDKLNLIFKLSKSISRNLNDLINNLINNLYKNSIKSNKCRIMKICNVIKTIYYTLLYLIIKILKFNLNLKYLTILLCVLLFCVYVEKKSQNQKRLIKLCLKLIKLYLKLTKLYLKFLKNCIFLLVNIF